MMIQTVQAEFQLQRRASKNAELHAPRTAAVRLLTGMPERQLDRDAGFTDLGQVVPLLRGPEYSITSSAERALRVSN